MSNTLQDVFNNYIIHLRAEKKASPYTVRNYGTDLMDFAQFLVDSKIGSLEQVNRQLLRAYLTNLVERGYVKGSIARKQSAIRSFYRYLLRESIIAESPVSVRHQRGQKLDSFSVKLDRRLPGFLSVEEAARFVESPEVSRPEWLRNRALLELLYAAGLRVSEVVRLDLDDVDLDTRQVRVFGKGAEDRISLFGEPARQALNDYLVQGRPQLLTGKTSRALFLTPGGGRITVRRVQKIVQYYAGKLGKRVHPHMLRHTFATHLLDGGADLKVVQELLGHASLSSTQIYSHVTKAQARKVYLAAHPFARKEAGRTEDGATGRTENQE